MHLSRRADLLDDGVAHDDDFVGQRQRFLLRMRDHDEGDVQFALQLFELDHHRLAQIEIQRAERLVEQEHSRSADQGARQCDTLLLTPGQIARPARREARKPHHLKHLPTRRSRALFSMPFIFRLNSTF